MKPFLLRGLESDNEYFCDSDVRIALSDCLKISDAMYSASSDPRAQEAENTALFAVYLKDKKNITLDFRGHTLFLEGEIQPFFLENCENIRIKNCVVEHDRSFATEFEVLESTPTYLRGKIFEKFPCKVQDGNLIPYSKTWENHSLRYSPSFIHAFNKQTRKGEGLSLVVFGDHPEIDESLPWANSTYRLRAKFDGDDLVLEENGNGVPTLPVGSIAVIGHSNRKYSSIYAVSCKNLFIENFRIINGAGMGFFPQHTENIYIDGLKMTYDERSHGVHTNEADGIHAVACSGDFVLKNSVIEGTLDDAFNIHGNFYEFLEGNGDQITVVCGGSASGEYAVFGVGDTICIYRGATLSQGKTYTIRKIQRISERKKIFFLNRPAEGHEAGDIIENLSAQPKIYMENCKFGKTNTHGRFQSRGGVTVKNCDTELPFYLTGDMNFWFESSPVTNMTIENTTFSAWCATILCLPEFTPTEQAPYYHGSLTVKNCSFTNEYPIDAKYTENIGFFQNTQVEGKNMHLVLKSCGSGASDCAEIERREARKTTVSY